MVLARDTLDCRACCRALSRSRGDALCLGDVDFASCWACVAAVRFESGILTCGALHALGRWIRRVVRWLAVDAFFERGIVVLPIYAPLSGGWVRSWFFFWCLFLTELIQRREV
jgi:hypothetical protein